MSGPTIRPAAEADMAALNAIYNHYILHTPATFDIELFSLDGRLEWFSRFSVSGPHRVFVAVEDGEVVGAAWSSQFRPKQAYDTTVETSVYCAPGFEGRGLGSMLYAELFRALNGERLHRAIAAVTQPNNASNALHRKFGFREAGLLREVGYKFGQYWDVAWFEKDLPHEPR